MKDYTGQRIGKLVIIKKIKEYKSNGRQRCILLAKCDCGNTHEVDVRNLYKTHSCGCSKLRKSNQHYKNRVFSFYQKNARRKDHVFELEFDEFIEMTQQECYYCGCEPSNNYKLADDGFEFKYNGIDRVDNSKGYVKGNVVTCCKTCNGMKSNMSHKEFTAQIEKIYLKMSM